MNERCWTCAPINPPRNGPTDWEIKDKARHVSWNVTASAANRDAWERGDPDVSFRGCTYVDEAHRVSPYDDPKAWEQRWIEVRK